MSFLNGAVPHVNGNLEEVELQVTTNGYAKEDRQRYEKEANGYPLVGNGIDKLNHVNGNIPKYRVDCNDKDCLPFELLSGEFVEQNTLGKEAWVMLTNFRLFVCQGKSYYNIPARCIEYVEMRDMLGLHVHCKDGKVMRIAFDCTEDCSDWWRYITSSEASQSRIEDLFAFKYFMNLSLSSAVNGVQPQKSLNEEGDVPMYVSEIRRMGFDTSKIWRTTEVNSKYELCKTYPKFHIVPKCISDDDLKKVAQFRSLRRFPSVVWRNKSNGAVIVRSSQPEVGWLGWRCNVDESMLPAIGRAAMLDSNSGKVNMAMSVTNVASSPLPFLVIDARSYAAAVANRAKGGGCECQEYYPNCEIRFMGLPNIHAIRKSFQSVRALGLEQNNWWSALEATKWMNYLSCLIKSALVVVEAVDIDAQSTLVHCSDGWDRTPQLVSLAQLLLDPYYRTIKGFRILIEREWLEFGHKFADRCGHSVERDINERSPVFFQWLHAVYQVMTQFPSAFEFNEFFLVKLATHAYSCLFGTFLCNSARERQQLKIKQNTVSVWDLLLSGRKDLLNCLYSKTNKVLYPSFHVRNLRLWEAIFLGKSFQNQLDEIPPDLTKSLELTDSGNSTMNSEVVNHKKIEKCKVSCTEYSSSKISRKTENGPTRKISASLPDNKLLSEPLQITKSSASRESKSFTEKTINSSDSIVLNKKDIVDSLQNRDRENLITNTNTVDNTSNDQILNFSPQENSLDKSDITNSSSSQSTLNDGDNTIEFRTNEILRKSSETSSSLNLWKSPDVMTDSLQTITGDNEHRRSLDDLCVNSNKSTPPPDDLDLSLGSVDHRGNAMRRAHSSPDSPSLNRLQRTKSVPDVMAASVCVNSDLLKQYPLVETNASTQAKLYSQNFRRFIDIDGLVFSYSFFDKKLIEMQNRHMQEILKLQKKYEAERQMRIQLQQHFQNSFKESYSPGTYSEGIPEDLVSLPDSVNGERSSVSSISNDEGWEQVQYDDVQPTRWLPDHVSPSCSSCGCYFSILIRRHHCRKCGGVFCDGCSNHQIALPEEQLYSPVRVCDKCYYVHYNINLG